MDKDFGQFIRRKRKEKNLKLMDLAEKVGISAVYASYIERGNRAAPVKSKLEAFARELELSPEDTKIMYHLAKRTHIKATIPSHICNYIVDKPYVTDIVLFAIEHDIPKEEWLEFKNKIEIKYSE